jgi:hypothetical protein
MLIFSGTLAATSEDTFNRRAGSRIVWSDARLGMELEFERIDPGRQAMVDQFVERQFFKNRRA